MRIEIMKREMKITFVFALVSILCVCNIQAEIIWDSGHHIFSEGSEDYVYMYNDASAEIVGGEIDWMYMYNEAFADITGGQIWELYMYNSTTADISGGYVSILLGQDTSSVDVYAGSDIGLLRPNDSSTANVYGGTINHLFVLGNSTTNIYEGDFTMGFSANDSPVINMYVQEYHWDPDGGSSSGFGLLTGTWLNSGEAFSIDYVDLDSFDHIAFVPEPSTMLLVGLGGLVLRTKK